MAKQTQAWRVVTDDGATKEVVVESVGLLRWVVSGQQIPVPRRSQREAIAVVWSNIVEIRGPGELTTAEQLAQLAARCEAAEAHPMLAVIREMDGSAWPLRDVLKTLVEASDHLKNVHDCDTHGHELFWDATEAAREALKMVLK